MNEKNIRKPFSNFFIKKSIQLSVIFRILFVLSLTAILTTLSLAYIYNSKSKQGTYYYWDKDLKEEIEVKSILENILPSVIAAEVISIVIGLGIGLFSSRKVAVPIYKIENWVTQLKKGKLNTQLAFREQSQMRELTVQCNAMADHYRQTISDLKGIVSSMEQNQADPQQVAREIDRASQILEKFVV